jgi:hypothetical protein
MIRGLVVALVVMALLGAVVELSCVAGELTRRPSLDLSEIPSIDPDLPIASEEQDEPPPLAASPALTR